MDWRFFFGVVIFEFAETLDSTDGDIARYKNLKSRLGVWLEIFFDSILTTVWGVMGILFAYISYKIDGNFIYFIIWGLISFAVNLEKSFILSFFPPKNDFKNASHTDIYFGFVGENWKIKIRNFLILSKSWENQWLIFGGLFYVLFEINIFLEIWVWLLMLNQIHWVRLAYKGYKSAKDYS
jgi:phosphatidylglycerophosphate synthase